MVSYAKSLAALALAVLSAYPAHACRGGADDAIRPDFNLIRSADLVVVGTVTNYETLIGGTLKNGWGGEYARFDINVDEVLLGSAPRVLSVTIDYMMYEELPSMDAGPYVIGLRDPRRMENYYGASPELMNVIERGCDGAFVFRTESKEAGEVRRLLTKANRMLRVSVEP